MKKNERIFEQLSEVNEEFIVEAAPSTKAKAKRNIIKWSAAAAVGAAAAGIIAWQSGILEKPYKKPESGKTDVKYGEIITFPEHTGELEIIHTDGSVGTGGGGGMGGHIVNDISQIIGSNPTREGSSFTELPVFKGSDPALPDTVGYPDDEDQVAKREKMEAEVRRMAAIFSDDEVKITKTNRYNYYIDAETDIVKINLSDSGQCNIIFKKDIELPEEFKLICRDNDSLEKSKESVLYICDKYRELLRFDTPEAYTFSDHDIYNNMHTTFYAYDKSDDPLTALLNYNFKTVSFATSEKQIAADPDSLDNPYDGYSYSGDLGGIYISNYLPYDGFIGNYPIISYDEAYKKLLDGEYIEDYEFETFLPDGIKEDEIFYSGIKYARTSDYKHFIPYYAFYIEYHQERTGEYQLADGLKEYGICYIPALDEKYMKIENTNVAVN